MRADAVAVIRNRKLNIKATLNKRGIAIKRANANTRAVVLPFETPSG